MIALNRVQAGFYDAIHDAEANKGHGGYAGNRSANVFTRLWADLRYRQQAAVREAGIEARMKEAHAQWIAGKHGGDYLELGCFSGSPSTFPLVAAAGRYTGIELSPRAVGELNRKLAAQGLAGKARAIAGDFLAMGESEKFDLIYAHGVLHHFENPTPLFQKLAAILKPDGVLLFVEPSAVNPVYRAIRRLYRPFQSDAAWEWPFRERTVTELGKHFEVVEGFGWGRKSLLLSVLTGMPLVGGWVTRIYVRMVRAEMAAGWHSRVWNNSMVTAYCRRR